MTFDRITRFHRPFNGAFNIILNRLDLANPSREIPRIHWGPIPVVIITALAEQIVPEINLDFS